MITWVQRKREINLAKHGFDLADAGLVLDGPVLVEEDLRGYDEQRLTAIGLLRGLMVHLTYTIDSDGRVHAISLRRADKPEVKRFVQYHQA